MTQKQIKTEELPKVGVIVTEHNERRLPMLVDCLSALNFQTYPNLEILIVDDSGRNGLTPLAAFIKETNSLPLVFDKNPKRMPGRSWGLAEAPPSYKENKGIKRKIHYLRNEKQLGASGACLRGIEEFKKLGIQYIALQDGDDISLPYRINMQLQTLLKNPSLVAASGDKLEIGERSGGYQSRFNLDVGLLRISASVFGAAHFKTNLMVNMNNLKFPLFDEKYVSIGDDVIMNSRIAQSGDSIVIPSCLTYYRRHGNNLSNEQELDYKRKYKMAFSQCFYEVTGIEIPEEIAQAAADTHKSREYKGHESFINFCEEGLSQSKYLDPEKVKAFFKNLRETIGVSK